jgi:predicted phosphodiesterase
MPNRAWRRYFALALFSGLCAVFATTLIPPIDHDVGPAGVSIKTNFGGGLTELTIAPLGTVSATTHTPPFDIGVSLSELDLQEFGQTLSESSQRDLVDEIEAGLRAAALQLGVRQVIGAAVVGLIAAVLISGRRPGYLITGTVSGAAFVALGLAIASLSFDLDNFEDASYTGALEYAPQVMEAVNRGPDALDDLNSRFATAATRLRDLMALVAQPLPDPNEGTTAILHVSDIHSNPLGIQVARRLATDFGVDAVVDTGDLTSFGQPIEARLGKLLESFPVAYLFVPGNHDSTFNRQQLAKVDGVELLDEEVYSVGNVWILGWADPTFTAGNEISTDEANAVRDREAPEIAAAVEELQPDVLVTHDERLAADSLGIVPLVLTGHTHERAFEEAEGTLLLTVGSTGATGLGSFIIETDRPYEAEVIYFQDDDPIAVDYLQLSGLGGDFEVERRTLDEETQPPPSPPEP